MTAELWYQAAVLGAGFGLLHAFDGDHLATIGGLAINDRSLSPTGYALRWALGHGAALTLIAAVALGLGFGNVTLWAAYGEWLVCLALLGIGVQALICASRRVRQPSAPALGTANEPHVAHDSALHVHFMAPAHAHTRAGRASVVMGLVHGGAGSAAVLALLPLAHFRNGFDSALYLLSFSAGVAIGALAFAAGFSLLARRAAGAHRAPAAVFQAIVGALAIASAVSLYIEIAHGGG